MSIKKAPSTPPPVVPRPTPLHQAPKEKAGIPLGPPRTPPPGPKKS